MCTIKIRTCGVFKVIRLINHMFLLSQDCNPGLYANTDAVFTLVYAVIMLNVDQHNANIKQQKPMTVEVSLGSFCSG